MIHGVLAGQIELQKLKHMSPITKTTMGVFFFLAHISHYELIVHNNKTLDVCQHK